jgi:multidrug efflux pump subunit AcrA (membrane-fusion protein)
MPNQLQLLSTEVQEIISNNPNWIIRNGNLIFLLIIGILIGCTFFISYPDIVKTNATLVSINSPKEVKSKIEGKLIKLNAIEGKYVLQNELLGFIESTANHNEVIMLSKIIDSVQVWLQQNQTETISSYLSQPFLNLGEVQSNYQNFSQAFVIFKQYLSSGYFLKKKGMLKSDMVYLQRLHSNLIERKAMQQQDVSLAKETFDANASLKDDKIISPLDYRNEKSKYINKAVSIPQINAALIDNENNQHQKQKEIAQLENEIAQQKIIFTEALNTLKSNLEDWKSKYLLLAPIAGKITFAQFIQENQQVKSNQPICFINPQNTQYFAQLNIPQYNFGKIKQKQKVLLKIAAYPYQEFGTLKGELSFIAAIPTDSGYLAKVVLKDGLKTNYQKTLLFHEGLTAQAEVITEDLKLSDRLFNQIRQLIKKN